MREIGGYFGLEEFSGKEYHHDLVAVNSARNALLYILKARKVRKLYIPYFLCDTVAELCKREQFPCEEYSIGRDFLPVFDRPLEDGAWLYVVNFYGQISNEQIAKMKKHWDRLIMDNVQAFFQRPVTGVDTVYSCRKFFGVPDGGYLATDAVLEEILEQDISKDRMLHILGRFEGNGSDYYRDFQKNDESFYTLELRSMSRLTHNILRAVDYEAVRQKRNKNYAILAATLDKENRLTLRKPDGPYCYPFYCENGMAIKKHLAQKGIYVPTLWPNVLNLEETLEKDYAENILPLPCDQRYGEEDMKQMLCLVLQHLAEHLNKKDSFIRRNQICTNI